MCCWQSEDDMLYDLSRDPIEKKEGFIPWDKFVNLLEGFEVTLPAPMNHFSENVVIKKNASLADQQQVSFLLGT